MYLQQKPVIGLSSYDSFLFRCILTQPEPVPYRLMIQANYTAHRMVLAASGVEHEELLNYAESLLSDFPGGAVIEEPESVYVGGDHRVMAN